MEQFMRTGETSSVAVEAPVASMHAAGGVSRVRAGLTVAVVLVLYSNLALYLKLKGVSAIPPAAYAISLGVLGLGAAVAAGNTWRVLWSPLSAWLAGYLALTALSFVMTPASAGALEILGVMLQGMLYVGMTLFILADPLALRVGRTAIAWCVVAGVLVNFYDLTHPLLFSPFPGRAAGLYLNPNISATALVLGMIAAWAAIPRRFHTTFALLVGGGVAATLSRGGVVGYLVALAGLLWSGELRWSRVALGLLTLLAVGWAALVYTGLDVLLFRLFHDLGLVQITRFTGEAQDYGTRVRFEVARAGWKEFVEAPILGGGIGRTFTWALPESTHNMYLRGLAEMGVLGGLVFPASAICAILWLPPDRRLVGRIFLATWLVLGIGSHNMLEERPELTILALFAAEGIVARRASRE